MIARSLWPRLLVWVLLVWALLVWALLVGVAPAAAQAGAAERVVVIDSAGKVVASSKGGHLWISRELLPTDKPLDPSVAPADGLRWLVFGAGKTTDAVLVSEVSRGMAGSRLVVPLRDVKCAEVLADTKGVGDARCSVSSPVHLYADPIDAVHPSMRGRVLVTSLGTQVTLELAGKPAFAAPVGPPPAMDMPSISEARLAVKIVRAFVGGPPALGSQVHRPAATVAFEAERASLRWAQCGFRFSGIKPADVRIVDPPDSQMLSIGCDLGLPASGGVLRFAIDDKPYEFSTEAGQLPREVAASVRSVLLRAGWSVSWVENPRLDSGVFGSFDLTVRRPDGTPARVTAVKSPRGAELLSTDLTLNVCLGEVDLAGGLPHFRDGNSATGTPEERALLRAVMDDDPTSIDVIVIPWFAETGRVGESFIESDNSSFQNLVIVDRGGLAAGPKSFVLAHELGHVLMTAGGHPDDFGVDHPGDLMDADAADDTPFGPRRLSLEDCQRAWIQSGPSSPLPLLAPVAPASAVAQ